MKRKKLVIPHNCYLILTSNCNMRCLHCYGSYGVNIPKYELTGDEWINVIEDLSKNGVFFVNISGGEPTMHPDFIKIINALVKNEIYFMITTNGVFNKKIKNAILNAKDYILGIQISLDGPDWISHGFLRKNAKGKMQKELFDCALDSIITFVNNGIRTSVATCLSIGNIDKVDEMKDLILKIKPSSWSISTISISGRARDNSNLYASESKYSINYWNDLKLQCEQSNINVSFVDMPSTLKESARSRIYYECPAANWFCEIYSNGIVTPCPLSRVNPPKSQIQWDNIKEKSIKDIWNGEAFNEFRKYQNIGCEGCNAKDKCDRCPPQSVQWFNDPLMPTPYCIENGEHLCLKNLDELKKMLIEAKKNNNRQEYGVKEEENF